MAYRKLENVGERIIDAVIKIGARDGIKECTAAKVAAECDVSDFTVLQYYGSKQGYLKAAAESIDRRFMAMIYRLIDEGYDTEGVWRAMHVELIASPDSVLYYNRYHSVMEKGVLDASRIDEWLSVSRKLFGQSEAFSEDIYLFLWDYITTAALMYAEMAIQNPQFNKPRGIDLATQIVFKGIDSFLE